MSNRQGSDGQDDGAPAGLFASLRGVLLTVLGIAGTRIELIGVEIAEERERLVGLLITAVAVVFAFSFAALLLTLLVVALFWENRVIALGACAAAYAAAGTWLLARLRTQLTERPALFAATIAELEKDRDALRETLKRPPGVPPMP
jgi:uncharacterized membrane protein YqjE